MELKLTKDNFEELVLKSDKPVLVEFWAPWCVYCRRLAPLLDKLAEQQEDVVIAQVNIDDEPLLANRERIEVIPTLILYRDGQPLGSIVAPESKARIEAFIRQALEK